MRWGLMDKRDEQLTQEDLACLDRLADLTKDEVPEFEKVRELYENEERLKVPKVIQSFTQAGVLTIDLGQQ